MLCSRRSYAASNVLFYIVCLARLLPFHPQIDQKIIASGRSYHQHHGYKPEVAPHSDDNGTHHHHHHHKDESIEATVTVAPPADAAPAASTPAAAPSADMPPSDLPPTASGLNLDSIAEAGATPPPSADPVVTAAPVEAAPVDANATPAADPNAATADSNAAPADSNAAPADSTPDPNAPVPTDAPLVPDVPQSILPGSGPGDLGTPSNLRLCSAASHVS